MRKPTTKARRTAARDRVSRRANLSNELVAFRERTGWGQGKVAAWLGCDRTQVSRWERGQICAVPLVREMLALGSSVSVPLLAASLAAVPPADVWAAVERVAKVEGLRSSPPRTLGRMAALVGLVGALEPGALVAPAVEEPKPDVSEQRRAFLQFAAMARAGGDEANARRWEAQAEKLSQ